MDEQQFNQWLEKIDQAATLDQLAEVVTALANTQDKPMRRSWRLLAISDEGNQGES